MPQVRREGEVRGAHSGPWRSLSPQLPQPRPTPGARAQGEVFFWGGALGRRAATRAHAGEIQDPGEARRPRQMAAPPPAPPPPRAAQSLPRRQRAGRGASSAAPRGERGPSRTSPGRPGLGPHLCAPPGGPARAAGGPWTRSPVSAAALIPGAPLDKSPGRLRASSRDGGGRAGRTRGGRRRASGAEEPGRAAARGGLRTRGRRARRCTAGPGSGGERGPGRLRGARPPCALGPSGPGR